MVVGVIGACTVQVIQMEQQMMPIVMVENRNELVESCWYQKCHTEMFQRWDGVSWSRGVVPPAPYGFAQGIGDGSNVLFLVVESWNGYPSNTNFYFYKWKYVSRRTVKWAGLLTFVNMGKCCHYNLNYHIHNYHLV